MRRAGLFVLVTFCMLATTGVAQATENLEVTNGKGERLARSTGTVKLELAFTSSECTFEESDGNLESENPESLIVFMFPHLKEGSGCLSYEGTKTRFYHLEMSRTMESVSLELESNSTEAKFQDGSCLYGIRKMSGSFGLGSAIKATVSGVGKLKKETAGCAEHPTLTANMELLNQSESEAPFDIRE